MPQAVVVALTFNDDITIFNDVYIVFGEQGGTIVITELADGDKRACGETFEDMASGGWRGKVRGKWDLDRLLCLHDLSVGRDDFGTFGGNLMVGTGGTIGLGDEVIGGTGVGDATGGRRRRGWGCNFR